MNIPPRLNKKIGFGVDLAFTVVVLASYFATFSASAGNISLELILMVFLGIIYIAIGIYGFSYCMRSSSPLSTAAYFIIQIILGGCIVILGKGAGFNAMVLFPLAGHSVMLLSSYWIYVANFGISLAYILATYSFSASWSEVWAGLPTFLAGQIFIVIFTQMAINEERGQSEVVRLVGELADANQQLREYALQVEELTITKERNRMAREIHDGVGHYLTTIHIQIQAARAVFSTNPKKSKEALGLALDLTQDALAEIRNSVASLRASPEDVLPLDQRINKLMINCSIIGITPHFQTLGTPYKLTPQVEWTVYRAAQEAINNSTKHSRASDLWITLDYSNKKRVRLNIKDNGIGSEYHAGGFGLVGLEERVNLLNGEVKITSATGEGFEIEIRIPNE
jgi:signal transduction histidine kinase